MDVVFGHMYHPVEVTDIHYLSNHLKRVRFQGGLSKTKFTPGNVIEFRVTPTDYRHYTPSYFNAGRGVCEVIFYLHGKGAGSQWASQLRVGDKIKLLGPGGKLAYTPSYTRHFVFGDETSLGLMICIHNETHTNDHDFFALTETTLPQDEWLQGSFLQPLVYVPASFEQPAVPAIEYLNGVGANWRERISETCFYLTGRAKSILSMRKYLLSCGADMKQIKTEPYWAEGKSGL